MFRCNIKNREIQFLKEINAKVKPPHQFPYPNSLVPLVIKICRNKQINILDFNTNSDTRPLTHCGRNITYTSDDGAYIHFPEMGGVFSTQCSDLTHPPASLKGFEIQILIEFLGVRSCGLDQQRDTTRERGYAGRARLVLGLGRMCNQKSGKCEGKRELCIRIVNEALE